MATPTISLRVAPEHQSLVREVAARLKTDPGFAGELQAALGKRVLQGVGQAVLQSPKVPPAGPLAEVLNRLDALESAVAEMRPKIGRPRHGAAALARAKAFRADVAAFAKAQGTTVAELARRLASVTGNTVKSEEKVLRGERPASAEVEARTRQALGMVG